MARPSTTSTGITKLVAVAPEATAEPTAGPAADIVPSTRSAAMPV
ncbi:MAG TPA: hypothetical protein VIZ43_06355 [Trebonia sp.]